MKPQVNENQIDTITKYLIGKGVDPVQARKYALVALGKGDLGDITNESIGTINFLINPNAIQVPNPEDEKAVTDYIIGATSKNYVFQLTQEALKEAAPEWYKAKTEYYKTPEAPFFTTVIDAIELGKGWPSIQTMITQANQKRTDPAAKAALQQQGIDAGIGPNGFKTPFDNMTYNNALAYAKTLYDQKVAGDKNVINKKQKYLSNDPLFTKGILPETFKYGLETNYSKGIVAHPLTELIKRDADADSSAAAESVFGYTPSGLTSDVATRRFAAENKSSKKTIPGQPKPMNALELKNLAFQSAAKQYLGDYTANGRTPALDIAEQRLLLGTIGKK